MKVVFVAALDGSGRLRAEWPAEGLRERGWDVDIARAGWSTTGDPIAHWPTDLPDGSLLVIHRPMASGIDRWVSAYREVGMRVLVDEVDDMNCVPLTNHTLPTPEHIATHETSIREADGLIVSTPRLQEVYGPLARRSWVVPALMASWVYDVRPNIIRRDLGVVRVGWAGHSWAHVHDLSWLRPAAVQGFGGATLSLVGDMHSGSHLGWEGPVERFGWQSDIRRYYELMARADIGMVPLDNGPNLVFSTAKSFLKALEYGALGKPVVAVDLPEQRKMVVHGVTGFLASDPWEFMARVRQLVADPELRERMGAAAREQAQRFSIPAGIGRWEECLRAFQVAGTTPRRRQPRERAGVPRDPVRKARAAAGAA